MATGDSIATTDGAGLPTRRDWLYCGFLALAALIMRLGLIFIWQTYKQDSSYVPSWYGAETGAVARSIAEGHGFASPFGGATGPTAWLSPFYPYICAGVFKAFGVFSDTSAKLILSFNSVCSALTCFPMFAAARRIESRRAAYVAVAAWALVPLFMSWPTTWFWEVSLSALCVTVLCAESLRVAESPIRSRWALLGLTGGASVLVNPALATVFAAAVCWPVLRDRRASRVHLRNAAFALLLAVAVTGPWLVRNFVVFGRPVFLRSNFAFELDLGNYHLSNGMGWGGRHPMHNRAEYDRYAAVGELAYVREHGARVVEFVGQHPGEFFGLTAHRVLWFWDGTYILYTSDSLKPWMFWSLSVLGWLGGMFAVTRKRNGAMLLLAVLIVYPLPYYITYTQHRYRHPVEPILLVTAAFLVDVVLKSAVRSERVKAEAEATAC